jgi:hypothetical protein
MNESASRPGGDHPQGTLVIVCVFGGLVVLGWLVLFFGVFLPRGAQ